MKYGINLKKNTKKQETFDSLTAFKDLGDRMLFSTAMTLAYLVSGGKFSVIHFFSSCMREYDGTHSFSVISVSLNLTIPMEAMPQTRKLSAIVNTGNVPTK